ncbi:NUDIX domain-containing protein [Streptomyces sp. NRAIS4]
MILAGRGARWWFTVGGGVEDGESYPRAAVREVWEEAALCPRPVRGIPSCPRHGRRGPRDERPDAGGSLRASLVVGSGARHHCGDRPTEEDGFSPARCAVGRGP